MVSPQVEDGYTRIANEIMEALARIKISGQARQILDVIIRQTYGWNKKSDRISLTRFQESTGLDRSHVCRSLRRLKAMNLIVSKKALPSTEYSFNKDYATWVVPKKALSVKKGTKCQKGLDGSAKKGTYKRKSKRKRLKTYSSDSIEIRFVEFFIKLLKERDYPFRKGKLPDKQKWAKHFDLMIRRDGRKPEEIKQVIEWCQKDVFWQDNILSPGKLREQYEKLILRMRKEEMSKPKPDSPKLPAVWVICPDPLCIHKYDLRNRDRDSRYSGCPKCGLVWPISLEDEIKQRQKAAEAEQESNKHKREPGPRVASEPAQIGPAIEATVAKK